MASARQGSVVAGTAHWVKKNGGSVTILAAVSGYAIRVVQAAVTASAATTWSLHTVPDAPAATAAISPLWHLDNINGLSIVLPYSPFGWTQTGVGEGLSAVRSGAADTAILIGYVLVEADCAV